MNIKTLIQSTREVQASSDGKVFHPLRPQTAENTFLWPRMKAAWRVLCGRSDAIEWGDWNYE
jgi:hypothetical protein